MASENERAVKMTDKNLKRKTGEKKLKTNSFWVIAAGVSVFVAFAIVAPPLYSKYESAHRNSDKETEMAKNNNAVGDVYSTQIDALEDISRSIPKAKEWSARNQITKKKRLIKNAIASRDKELASLYINQAYRLIDYISNPAELHIVVKEGIPSVLKKYIGHEINYFAIVQSPDLSGEPFPRNIKSSEYASLHSDSEEVKMWGLGIEKDLYDRLFDEKSKTGTIANTLMGTKDPGKYTIKFKVNTTIHSITYW